MEQASKMTFNELEAEYSIEKREPCPLCNDKEHIGFFFAQDDCKSCVCPKCSGGSWKIYNKLKKEFDELGAFNALHY